jgi:hypothetical protein
MFSWLMGGVGTSRRDETSLGSERKELCLRHQRSPTRAGCLLLDPWENAKVQQQEMHDDVHLSIELMSRLASFAEMVLDSNVETTRIERTGDAPFGCFESTIWTRFNQFVLRSAGPTVQLFYTPLDAPSEEQTLLTEVLSSDSNALAALRTIVFALEALGEMRARKDSAGLRVIQKVVDEALITARVQLRRRRWL